MSHPLIIVPFVVIAVAGGALLAWQFGALNFDTPVAIEPEQDSGAGLLEQGDQETTVCPAVCVEMWRFNSVTNDCTFVECGSGCGSDGVETFGTQAQCEAKIVFVEEEEETSGGFTVEEYEAKPTLCQSDSDCKVIPITCNQCDCGRAVNVWIEPYACTEADKANSCGFVCPPSKAVCEAGSCKKVDL